MDSGFIYRRPAGPACCPASVPSARGGPARDVLVRLKLESVLGCQHIAQSDVWVLGLG